MNNREFSKKEIKKLLDKMFSLYNILNDAGYRVNEFGNSFCPFHDNDSTPAAKYYSSTDTLHCFAEGKTYHVIDGLNLVGKNPIEVFYNKWSTYNNDIRQQLIKSIDTDINVTEETIKFKPKLKQFSEGLCTYQDLCVEIAKTSSRSSLEILEKLYNISHEIKQVTIGSSDYEYLAWRGNLKHIRKISMSDIAKSAIELPKYLNKFFQQNTQCIIIFNMCGKIPLSCIIRGIKTKKFTNIGNNALFYNICCLKKDFKYGDRLTIVEGPKDCEVYRNIFNDKNCVAINTAPISTNKALILKYLTDNIVLAQDNDEPGTQAKNRFKRYYSKSFKINEFKHDDSLKDFGDLIPLLRNDYNRAIDIVKKYQIRLNNFI